MCPHSTHLTVKMYCEVSAYEFMEQLRTTNTIAIYYTLFNIYVSVLLHNVRYNVIAQ